NSVALVAFGSTWTIMVIVAFRTQRLRSAVMFLLPMPRSVSSASVLPLVRLLLVLIVLRSVIQPLLVLRLACHHPSMNHVHTFMKLHYWTLTLIVSQTSTFITGASSLILSRSRCSEILDYVANLLSEVILSLRSSAQSRKQDDKTKKEAKGKSHVESFTGYRDLSLEFEDFSKNSTNEVNAAGTIVPTVGKNSSNSTNPFSATELEDITYSDDENDVGAEADFNNLETSITVSPIPTTRIHKDHSVSQIIGDLSSTTKTRKPKRVHQALKELSWIEAMKEDLLQNRKDERGIVVRNKARLVTQGYTQEEGIDYEEFLAIVERIEAIRLFLAYASFMGFMVYQMDVKSANLYGTIEEEVYVCQPLGFKDLDHPDKVNKVIYVNDIIFGETNKDFCKSFEKLMKDKFQMSSMGELTFFLVLQVKQKKDGKFICQDKYVAEILWKFGLTEGKSASTPIDIEKPLLKDPDVEDVDVHTYRSMIGSLMYLTSSRPDIMFAAEYVAAVSCCAQRTSLRETPFLHTRHTLSVSIDSLSPQVVFAAKLPILNPNEFDLWKMRMEQYLLITDYLLWEVILNGDSPVPTRLVEGVVQPVAHTTVEQKLA
nr:hypothetical protein [Tanacetum cinerariifolium]